MAWKKQKSQKGFGYGGFSLGSSFHKAGQLTSFQKQNKSEGWRGKQRSEDE